SVADANQAKEKALGENENATTPRATVPAEFQGLIADPGRGDETEQIIQQRLAQRQRKMEELRARRMEHAVVRPGEETPSPTPSPTPQAMRCLRRPREKLTAEFARRAPRARGRTEAYRLNRRFCRAGLP